MKSSNLKKWIAGAVAVLMALSLLSCGGTTGNVTRRLEDLGIPLAQAYTDENKDQMLSRRSEDIAIFDGRLYVGCGDYSANTGPVNVYSMGLSDRKWQVSAEALEDEQIKRFLVLDGKLCIPGTDPRGDWSMGNYYLLSDGAWQTHRVLPSGIHCFDGIEFEENLFFGLGAESGSYPVVVSEGDSFVPVPFLRDGEAVNTSGAEYVRVYNLSVWNGQLYAFLTLGNIDDIAYDVYRYDGEVFQYHATPPEVFRRGYDLAHTLEFSGMNTFINGYCYFITEDMESFRPWRVGDSDLACDMERIGDTLYVLAYRELERGYESAVYASEDGKQFEKLFYFEDSLPAACFAYADGTFYFSMGRYYDADDADMGRVFALEFDITQ